MTQSSSPGSRNIPVQELSRIHADGERDEQPVVACPRRGTSVALSVCETCIHFERLAVDGDGAVVQCTPRRVKRPSELGQGAPAWDPNELALRVSVGEAMARRSICVDEDTTVEIVRRFLCATRAPCVAVVSADGALVGLLTPHHVLDATGADILACEVMTHGSVGVPETAPLAHAIATMAQTGLTALPVIDADGAVIGCIGGNEVARFFARCWGYEVPAAPSEKG